MKRPTVPRRTQKRKSSFPQGGEHMTTAEYVQQYFKINNYFRKCEYLIGDKKEIA